MTGTDLFFYGTLCHAPLRRVVLGRDRPAVPARLPGFAAFWADGHEMPMIAPAPGSSTDGVLVAGLTGAEMERLAFYEDGFGYRLAPVSVEVDGADRPAQAWLCDPDILRPGAPWSLPDWVALHVGLMVEAASDFMALLGRVAPDRARAAWPQLVDRAAARMRASASATPVRIRRGGPASAIDVVEREQPYVGFFALQDWRLRFPTFGGAQSAEVSRTAFLSGDAVTVLPYDPVRDRVMLVEQFRFGALVRGDRQPWSLEPIAGRIDGDEDPELTARREAQEEAGLTLGRLIPVGRYYTSPGASTEYLWSYIGLADLPDDAAGTGGVAEEHEDIRTLLMDFPGLMELLDTGEAENGPLLISALALARHRDTLRR
jgi:ADP-ribose pyrophosphatase